MYESAFGSAGESYEFPGETGEWEIGQEAEALEAELAGELLEISSEAELEEFLGKLASSVMKGASRFVKSPIGKALGGVLKNVAKTALPAVGGALGSLVLPGAGTAIGAKLGSMAGGLLEAGEAEMMGEAEAQYEAAQRYVRFARTAWSNAARAPRNVPPRSIARAASISAARMHAPSLLAGSGRSSQWRRRRASQYGYGYPSYPGYQPAPWFVEPQGGGYDDPEPWTGAGSDYSDYPGEAEFAGGPGGQRPGPRSGGPGGQPGGTSGGQPGGPATQGTWVRRRNRIVLLGV